jgi:hypothetical protein
MIGSHTASAEFVEAAKRFMPFWDNVGAELREALSAAWEDARVQQASHVNKLHLLRALLKDGRVQSHVTLSERDIGKLTSLITDQLRITSQRVEPTDPARDPAAPPPALTWGTDLLQIMGDASAKARYWRHAKIDVWLVFDLLRADKDLDGNFTFAKSGFANDNDARITQIQELFHRANTETMRLSAEALRLESENQKLHGALRQTNDELNKTKHELARTREELTVVRGEFGRIQEQYLRLNDITARMGVLEQGFQAQQQQVNQLHGTFYNFAWPMIQQVQNALVSNFRLAQQHMHQVVTPVQQPTAIAPPQPPAHYTPPAPSPAVPPPTEAAQPSPDGRAWLNIGGLFGGQRAAPPPTAASAPGVIPLGAAPRPATATAQPTPAAAQPSAPPATPAPQPATAARPAVQVPPGTPQPKVVAVAG